MLTLGPVQQIAGISVGALADARIRNVERARIVKRAE